MRKKIYCGSTSGVLAPTCHYLEDGSDLTRGRNVETVWPLFPRARSTQIQVEILF